MKKQKQFDAPTFTRFVDSAGNVFHITAPEGQSSIFDARKGNVGIFQVGNVVTFEVEVDKTYSRYIQNFLEHLLGSPGREWITLHGRID